MPKKIKKSWQGLLLPAGVLNSAMAILLFRVKHGATDYATCHGLYRPVDPVVGDGHLLNGHLVYQNEEQRRFLGRSAGGWVIGPLSDLKEHLEQQRNLVGYLISVSMGAFGDIASIYVTVITKDIVI